MFLEVVSATVLCVSGGMRCEWQSTESDLYFLLYLGLKVLLYMHSDAWFVLMG